MADRKLSLGLPTYLDVSNSRDRVTCSCVQIEGASETPPFIWDRSRILSSSQGTSGGRARAQERKIEPRPKDMCRRGRTTLGPREKDEHTEILGDEALRWGAEETDASERPP